jgi:hypothetical protein
MAHRTCSLDDNNRIKRILTPDGAVTLSPLSEVRVSVMFTGASGEVHTGGLTGKIIWKDTDIGRISQKLKVENRWGYEGLT